MHTKLQYTALVAFAMLIIPAYAFADDSGQQNMRRGADQQANLNADLARITCTVNLVTSSITTAESDISNMTKTTIDADAVKLTVDLQKLQTDVKNNDKTSFRADHTVLTSDTKTAYLDIRSAVKVAHPTNDQMRKLKTDLADLKDKAKDCMFGARQQGAKAKISSDQFRINKLENRSAILKSKCVDTTGLDQTLGQAQTNLNTLAGSIASATNSSQLKTALQSYCQYNGCKTGTNFHLAAQSALAEDQAILVKIQANQNSAQYSAQISQVQTDLTNAKKILDTVGTGQYSQTQQTDVWNALHDAGNVLKQLVHELRTSNTNHSGSSTNSSSS